MMYQTREALGILPAQFKAVSALVEAGSAREKNLTRGVKSVFSLTFSFLISSEVLIENIFFCLGHKSASFFFMHYIWNQLIIKHWWLIILVKNFPSCFYIQFYFANICRLTALAKYEKSGNQHRIVLLSQCVITSPPKCFEVMEIVYFWCVLRGRVLNCSPVSSAAGTKNNRCW